MSVIRVQKSKNFTTMSNIHLRDKELSLKAKGLMSVMLSLPDDWNYSIAGLCAICKEKETSVKSTLNELRDRRYVIVERIDPSEETGGRIQYEYFVYEQPQGEENKKVDVKEAYKAKQEQGKQPLEKQGVENLGVEVLSVENMGVLLNTNIPSTDKTNTDLPKTEILNTEKEKADTLSKDNVKADTAFPKKSLPAPEKKKTKSELKELEADMIKRFYDISKQYDTSEFAFKNVVKAFKRYLDRYTERTDKIHPILKDETLEKIFVALATISDTEYSHFDNVADYEPDGNGLSYLDEMVDEHFKAQHADNTDWHISHFARSEYLEKMAQHIVNY